ncbi:MAG TPA: hypothetical protein VF661_00825 [Actinomycetales bacterium]|jgi:hypothetical protein
MSTTTVRPGARALSRTHDRCDACGAQALVLVTMRSGSDLLFCGHHYRGNEVGLAAAGATVAADER